MGLTFLHPAFLFGALATSVPVVIHLIHRRRALLHRFPAVRFLLLADQRTARKFRLRQWLLLALRILVILLLALILARPRLLSQDAQAAVALPAQALVLLVDNSLSMQYLDGEASRLQHAKMLASNFIQTLQPQDLALVLPLLERRDDAAPRGFLSQEPDTLSKQLAAIEANHAEVDIASTLQRAFAMLKNSPATQRRIVVLSDFTVQGWENFHLAQLASIPEHVQLHFVRIGGNQRDANLLLEGVRIGHTPLIVGVPLEVQVLIRNFSAQSVENIRVDLFVGRTKIGEQLVDLSPDERVSVPFRMTTPPAGLHWGEVRLAHDRFTEDDRFYYALRTLSPARVLLVDGDPGTSLFDNELFYLLSALRSGGAMEHPLFYAKPVTWEGLSQERLGNYQAVVLCNVDRLSAQIRQRLQQFVQAGGGLLMFAGNRVAADRYNAMFYHVDTPLLPFALKAPVQHAEDRPMRLAKIDPQHQTLTVFADQNTLLSRAKFYRYIAMQHQSKTPGVETLISFQDGQPFLTEKRLGNGRVMFFTSSADRDWTDLPTRPAYVPLIHSVLGHLTKLASASPRPHIMMPEPVVLSGRSSDLDAMATFRTPDGHERHIRYVAEKGQTVGRFEHYSVPGIYQVTTPAGMDVLAVNATRAESRFEKLRDSDLQTRFRPLPLVIEDDKTFAQTNAGGRPPVSELSAMFMLLLVAVLLVENAYSNRF
jgi:uncharacterized membrane protein